ncbi:MAG: cation transporter [Clostridiaceae bacterium]|nr:cation transporter [Clostridiaceae bacterium]
MTQNTLKEEMSVPKDALHGYDPDSMSGQDRKKAGLIAAVIGLLMNVVLAAIKLLIGTLSGSIAISADGWNNLTDSFSSVVSIISIRLAAKPADNKHPFGYARFEYIASSIIALGMLTVAVQVGYRSILRIIRPESLETSLWVFGALVFSIAVKLIQYFYYRNKGRKLVSPVFIAASKDSLSDVFATSGVLFSTILFAWFGINIDGMTGIFISLLIAWSAIGIMLNTATLLIGGKPSSELTSLIRKKILETDDRILDVHDLIVHDYGPGSVFATAHVELDSRESFLEAHLLVDYIERKLLREYDVQLLLHADPSDLEDAEHESIRTKLEEVASAIVPESTIHGLHLFASNEGTKVAAFDVQIFDKLPVSEAEFFASFREKMALYDSELVLWITLNQGFTSVISDDQPNLHVTTHN